MKAKDKTIMRVKGGCCYLVLIYKPAFSVINLLSNDNPRKNLLVLECRFPLPPTPKHSKQNPEYRFNNRHRQPPPELLLLRLTKATIESVPIVAAIRHAVTVVATLHDCCCLLFVVVGKQCKVNLPTWYYLSFSFVHPSYRV
jgi:hypothetical protein